MLLKEINLVKRKMKIYIQKLGCLYYSDIFAIFIIQIDQILFSWVACNLFI